MKELLEKTQNPAKINRKCIGEYGFRAIDLGERERNQIVLRSD